MQSRNWGFNIKDYTDEDILRLDKVECQYIIYGTDVTEQGTKHLQGFIQFKARKRYNTARKEIGIKAHIETISSKPTETEYCIKFKDYKRRGKLTKQGQGTIIKEMIKDRAKGKSSREMIEIYEDNYLRHMKTVKRYADEIKQEAIKRELQKEALQMTLRPWQTEVIRLLEAQNNRTILFVVDEEGNSGKSELANYLMNTRDCYTTTTMNQAANAYAYNSQPYAVFDISRKDKGKICYEFMSNLKDGFVFSTKWRSRSKLFRPAKVLVLMNFMPQLDAMSKDRYQFYKRYDGDYKYITQDNENQWIYDFMFYQFKKNKELYGNKCM